MLSSFLLSTHFSLSSSSLHSLHVEDFKINALFPLNYPFSANPTKWLNTLGNNSRVSLTIFWGWRLEGYKSLMLFRISPLKYVKKYFNEYTSLRKCFSKFESESTHCNTEYEQKQ